MHRQTDCVFGTTRDGFLQRGRLFEVSSLVEQGSVVFSSGSEDPVIYAAASSSRRAAHLWSSLMRHCIRYGVTLVSRLKMNACLFDFPSEKMPNKRGRPPSKGVRLINFKQMLSLTTLPWKEIEIVGYNGIKHLIRYVSDTCMWGADGSTPIPIRWMLVVDPTGKMDSLPLMSTDPPHDPRTNDRTLCRPMEHRGDV